uniref:Heparan-sulfate 6-O-sulfotransferase n=1 Tax=Macaca fascicularis TaxID=9541 RepID=A0A7N9CXA6_MACFA
MRRRRAGGRTMVERASKFVLVVAGSVCFMLILYQYAGPGLSLGAPGGRAPPDDLDLFPTPDPHYEKKYYFPVRELERSLRFDMKGDDVIVFLHIQKTGGTTFGRHLVQNVRLEVPCDCRPGQKKYPATGPPASLHRLGCGLHADWTELHQLRARRAGPPRLRRPGERRGGGILAQLRPRGRAVCPPCSAGSALPSSPASALLGAPTRRHPSRPAGHPRLPAPLVWPAVTALSELALTLFSLHGAAPLPAWLRSARVFSRVPARCPRATLPAVRRDVWPAGLGDAGFWVYAWPTWSIGFPVPLRCCGPKSARESSEVPPLCLECLPSEGGGAAREGGWLCPPACRCVQVEQRPC